MSKHLDWRRAHDDRLLREREIEPVESIARELERSTLVRPVAPGCKRCANCGSDVRDLERHVHSSPCFPSAVDKAWNVLVRKAPRDTVHCPGCDAKLSPVTLRAHILGCEPACQVIRAAVLGRRQTAFRREVPKVLFFAFHPPVIRRLRR